MNINDLRFIRLLGMEVQMNDESVKCKMCDENVVKKVDMNIHVKNIIKSCESLKVSVF